MRKLIKVLAVAVILSLFVVSCSSDNSAETTTETDTQTPTTEATQNTEDEPVVIEGTNSEKAQAIAETVNVEADGLLKVVRADVPLHGQTPTGYDYYGAHYRVVVLHSVHDMTEEDVEKVEFLTAKIFELTTQEILADSTDVTHMGVQVLYPEIWPIGFAGTDDDDPSAMYVASRRDLIAVMESNVSVTGSYLAVAGKDKAFVIRQSQLEQ